MFQAVYALRNFNENRKFNGANFPEFLPSYKQDDWFADVITFDIIKSHVQINIFYI